MAFSKVPKLAGIALVNEIAKRYSEAERKYTQAKEGNNPGQAVYWLTRQTDSAWLLSRLAGDAEWDKTCDILTEDLARLVRNADRGLVAA